MTFEQMWAGIASVGRSAATRGYFRQPYTSAELELRAWFTEECTRRGLDVEADGNGNLVAWWGSGDGAVLTGSHLDSVLDGGAYDGPLGVVSSLAAVDLLRDRGVTPRRPIGIGVFADEEGSRFGIGCLGSQLATGLLAVEDARVMRDRDGRLLEDVMAAAGLEPGLGRAAWLDRVGCYVELHVEQGRNLVDRDAAVGVASGIWPHGRWRFDFDGEANHAGATRMEDRRDPMVTFAQTALVARAEALSSGQRATFGRIEATPNGTNAVPSRVAAWLDARAEDDELLSGLVHTLEQAAADRAGLDGTAVTVTAESLSAAVEFDPALAARIAAPGGWPVIPTQAGHDAGILQTAGIPTAMLFVRNPTGISHSPEEYAGTGDCLAGVEALADTLQELTR
ncbi:allantoate amidohydrolase [Nocardioides jiangxiensis]|uniref:Allantoate amidohydrolase n=1 Tax=Nocardioides jiangxiensis TaxID=3064524 RepID=A0ABT9AWV0_9ACTN|nr:allantoate amidohydrolase [Nocardioides sp. WY-20]MDO7866785.1 allantoate amidohydrolase [Nocardioides sp. WY-20]